MESERTLYQDMDRLVALDRGLRTWARWVEENVDKSRTRVFFQSISPTHYKYVPLILFIYIYIIWGMELWIIFS